MIQKWAESPIAAGLFVGGTLSGFLLALSPFVVFVALILMAGEHPDLILWPLGLYALVLLLPLLTCCLIGWVLEQVFPGRHTGSVKNPF